MATPIEITLKVGDKTKTIVVDAHVINHAFVAHSLNLHNWVKMEKQKLIEEISEFNKKEDTLQKVEWFHNAIDDINHRRGQMEAFEQAFKELIAYPNAI